LGLGSPVTNQLAATYTDADQDLIADAPSDAAAWRDPETLRFCFLNEQAGGIDPDAWRPLLDALSEQTGRPVEYVRFPTVNQQLAALRDGGLDLTAFNTGNVPRAVNAAGFVPVAAPADRDGPAQYRMLLLATADSGIEKVEDLRGRVLALTRYGSNSGYKAPLVLLREFGLAPERDYDWAFSGSHDQSIAGLKDGTFVAAAVASDLYAAAVDAGQIDPAAVTVVYESEPFPRAAFGVAHDLHPDLRAGLTQALLGFDPTDTPLQLELPDTTGFAPLDYQDRFALIRRIDNAVGFKHEIDPPSGKTENPS
jgi:phosphonate transport system substrate-binding protein